MTERDLGPSSPPELHLVFGMARSGTSFLARALESVPGVAVFGESDFFARSYIEPGADGSYDRPALARIIATQARKDWASTTGERDRPLTRLAPGVYGQLVAEALDGLERASPGEVFARIAAAVARHTGCGTVIEKTPGHLLFVERVAAAVPNARCVASWREPAGFVRSFMQLDDRDPQAARRLLARLSRHSALGVMMWRSYMQALARARACLGDRLLIFDHATLAHAPETTLARVAEHLGVEAPRVDLRTLPRNQSPNQHAPTPADLQLWLRLLAPGQPAPELPPTTLLTGLRSFATLAPAGACMLARVLPQAGDRLGYLRGYLRQRGLS